MLNRASSDDRLSASGAILEFKSIAPTSAFICSSRDARTPIKSPSNFWASDRKAVTSASKASILVVNSVALVPGKGQPSGLMKLAAPYPINTQATPPRSAVTKPLFLVDTVFVTGGAACAMSSVLSGSMVSESVSSVASMAISSVVAVSTSLTKSTSADTFSTSTVSETWFSTSTGLGSLADFFLRTNV